VSKSSPTDKSFQIPKQLVWEAYKRVKANKEAYSGPRKTIFRTRRVAIGDGPLSGRIGFAHSTYRKWTVERVLYHRVLSL